MQATNAYLQLMKDSDSSEAKAIKELVEDVLEDEPTTLDKLRRVSSMMNEVREWAAGLEIAVDQDLRGCVDVAEREV